MKIGLIGCGKIASKAHIPAIAKINEAEIIAVSDLNISKARAVCKRFGIRYYFRDYREMLRKVDLDVVDICTPTQTHATIAIDAAKLGKHVLVEKPISYSLDEAFQMVDSAKVNGVKLCVIHNFRYFPAMQRMKNLIKNGRLGRILSIEGTCHQHFPLKWSPKTWWFNDGGIIYDVGIHMIDAILWFFGSPPETVYAAGGDYLSGMGCINHADVLMEFKTQQVAICDFSWLTGRTIFNLDIHGTGGHIFSDLCFDHFYVAHGVPTPIDDAKNFCSKMLTFSKELLSGKFFASSLAYHKPLIKEFIRSLQRGKKVPVTGIEGLRVLATAEAIKQSIKKNKKVKLQTFS